MVTRFSSVTVADENSEPYFIPDPTGSTFIPSVVSFDNNLDYAVGWEALEMAQKSPEQAVMNVKRLLGSNEKIRVGKQDFTPILISSLIISSLKKNAEEHLGVPVKKALVAVPGNFNIVQANALSRACDLAT